LLSYLVSFRGDNTELILSIISSSCEWNLHVTAQRALRSSRQRTHLCADASQ